jgi:hypothetical protein
LNLFLEPGKLQDQAQLNKLSEMRESQDSQTDALINRRPLIVISMSPSAEVIAYLDPRPCTGDLHSGLFSKTGTEAGC